MCVVEKGFPFLRIPGGGALGVEVVVEAVVLDIVVGDLWSWTALCHSKDLRSLCDPCKLGPVARQAHVPFQKPLDNFLASRRKMRRLNLILSVGNKKPSQRAIRK